MYSSGKNYAAGVEGVSVFTTSTLSPVVTFTIWDGTAAGTGAGMVMVTVYEPSVLATMFDVGILFSFTF
jgi:hypothetical protein